MKFRVLVKKSMLRVFPLAVVLIVLLNIISEWENLILRIGGSTLAVFVFSFLFITIEYFIYRRANSIALKKESKVFEPIFVEPDVCELEELAPAEEENDFGELLEVEDMALQPVEFTKPVNPVEPEKKVRFTMDSSSENIEELEVIEDPVEELEAIDE